MNSSFKNVVFLGDSFKESDMVNNEWQLLKDMTVVVFLGIITEPHIYLNYFDNLFLGYTMFTFLFSSFVA